MSWAVRRLTRKDFAAYHALRLEALTNHPEAYGTAAESFAARPAAEIEDFLSLRALFGVVTETGELAGIVLYDRDSGERESHRGWLLQVYLKPAMRGTGAALALLETAIAHAGSEVLQVHLMVGVHNLPAIRLYEKAGFRIYGTDPRRLYVNGRYIDEHMMVRLLDKAPGKTD
ncbi:GNAT family N-acetyltransferase [Devosia sp.]|uniref:GNAT family N-acetyltransferase n=1 Tax=Devosia sp. TaxID=1871048 RepID=UPI00273673E8|nr:GNAT family protein [Devosia sp.]MDP2780761.1 GNAT family protein [Devosia sp.]